MQVGLIQKAEYFHLYMKALQELSGQPLTTIQATGLPVWHPPSWKAAFASAICWQHLLLWSSELSLETALFFRKKFQRAKSTATKEQPLRSEAHVLYFRNVLMTGNLTIWCEKYVKIVFCSLAVRPGHSIPSVILWWRTFLVLFKQHVLAKLSGYR